MNFTLPATALFGRERELQSALSALDDGQRLVSLVGTAGVGKTRVALQAAWHQRKQYSGGVWLCDSSDGGDLSCSVRRTLGLEAQSARALAERGPLLLVLDHVDPMTEETRATIAQWLRAAPALRMLTTSRERLRVAGERCIAIDALATPDPLDEDPARIADCDAVKLFIDRARGVIHDFDLSPSRLRDIASVVRAAEGLPLAIELCAARVGVLEPAQILAQIAGHSGLRSAIARSWEALDPSLQRSLALCSVFRGGFDLDAAAAVLELGMIDTLEVIQELHDRSLLRAWSPGVGRERRYALYESVREFAAETREQEASLRHALHFARRGEALAHHVHTPRGQSALAALELEAENVVAAFRAALARAHEAPFAELALRMIAVLDAVSFARAPLSQRAAMIDDALAAAPSTVDASLRVRVLLCRAKCEWIEGRLSQCFDTLARAEKSAGGDANEALVYLCLASLHQEHRRDAEASACQQRTEALLTRVSDPWVHALFELHTAWTRLIAGKLDEALTHGARARVRLERVGDQRGTALSRMVIAISRLELGDARGAHEALTELRRDVQALGDVAMESLALGYRALSALALGRGDDARTDLERALQRSHEQPRLRGILQGFMGSICFEIDAPEVARAWLQRSVRSLREWGDERRAAESLAVLAIVELRCGRREEAQAYVHEASSAPSSAAAAIVEMYEAFDGGEAPQSQRQREVVRSLRRVLARAPMSCKKTGEIAKEQRLLVGPEARWFRLGDDERVQFSKQRALRLMLLALVDARLERPGSTLTLAELFDAGWPGERALEEAASNRVYVSLTRLRRLGLRAVIVSRDDGFLIDEECLVLRAENCGK